MTSPTIMIFFFLLRDVPPGDLCPLGLLLSRSVILALHFLVFLVVPTVLPDPCLLDFHFIVLEQLLKSDPNKGLVHGTSNEHLHICTLFTLFSSFDLYLRLGSPSQGIDCNQFVWQVLPEAHRVP